MKVDELRVSRASPVRNRRRKPDSPLWEVISNGASIDTSPVPSSTGGTSIDNLKRKGIFKNGAAEN